MQEITIFSDGACKGNPGPGGYGTILRFIDKNGVSHEKEISGGEAQTTNNRMELMGAIAGLEALVRPCRVLMVTDSQYVAKAFTDHWLEGWLKRNWKDVKNVDLWQRLLSAMEPHEVSWQWVKGHAGHPENERCDKLAVAKALEFKE